MRLTDRPSTCWSRPDLASSTSNRVSATGPIFLYAPLPSIAASYLTVEGILARPLRPGDHRYAASGSRRRSTRASLPSPPSSGRTSRSSPSRGSRSVASRNRACTSAPTGCGSTRCTWQAGGARTAAPCGGSSASIRPPATLDMEERAAHDELVRQAMKRIPRQDLLDQFWANEIPIAPVRQAHEALDRRAGHQQWHVGRGGRPGARSRPAGRGSASDCTGRRHPRSRHPSPRSASTPRRCSTCSALEHRGPARFGPAKRPLTHALEGIKVLDLGNFLAGPFGPMLLGDLGATVYKLESPEGDQMRPVTQPFNGCQRGKLDVVRRSQDARRARDRPSADPGSRRRPPQHAAGRRRATRRRLRHRQAAQPVGSSTATRRCGATTGRVPPGPASTSSASRRAASSTSWAARATRPTGTASGCATRAAPSNRPSPS